MKKYIVYLDDGHDCFKVYVPATSKKEVKKYVEGNGAVISIKDVTDDYPISIDKVRSALHDANFGQGEIDFITRCLTINNIAG